MSVAYGQIKDQLQFLIKDKSAETAEDMLRFTNLSVADITNDHFFDMLRTSIEVSGRLLPANAERLDYVQLDDTDFLSFRIQYTDRYMSPRLYNWFSNFTTTDPLITGTDGVATANSKTFTSAAPSANFTSALIGEFISIGTNLGMYEITAVPDTNTLTLKYGYRGVSASAQGYQVRPEGTKYLDLTDEQGTALSDATPTLYYQRTPLPVYNDHDRIQLPGTCKAVQIMVHQQLLLGQKYDNDALKREPSFVRAIADMNPLSPTQGRKMRPRNKFGNTVRFGRNRFVVSTDVNSRRLIGN